MQKVAREQMDHHQEKTGEMHLMPPPMELLTVLVAHRDLTTDETVIQLRMVMQTLTEAAAHLLGCHPHHHRQVHPTGTKIKACFKFIIHALLLGGSACFALAPTQDRQHFLKLTSCE